MAQILPPSPWCCVVLATTACASQGQQAPQPRVRDHALTVEVQNQNYNAATVYAYREGFRKRLGLVEAANTETFAFRWPTYSIRFLINFLAQGCVVTEEMSVDPGDDFLLVLRVIDHDDVDRSFRDVSGNNRSPCR